MKIQICRNVLIGIYPKSELDELTGPEIIIKIFEINVKKCEICGCENFVKVPLIIQRE